MVGLMLLTVPLLPSFFLLVLRLNTIAFTSTFRTTIMITVITTISISVAATITLPSINVLIHIIMINTILALIVSHF